MTRYWNKPTRTAAQRNKLRAQALKQLKTLCKKQRVCLYASHTDDNGRTLYLIKERPGFKAWINHQELEV